MVKIFPSLISSRILNLEEEIKILEPYCNGFHLDIMDFHFVQNLTFGPMFINEIAKISKKQLFVHLMVDEPEKWISILNLRKNDILSFHYESTNNHKAIIESIHKNNWLACIAISPQTSVEQIYPLINYIDQVLLMSVDPGFSGQKFIPEAIKKLENLVKYKKINNLEFSIAMDGGINQSNISELAKKGVDCFAISTAIFKDKNPINALEKLYLLVK